jgi:hypothetical protein
MKRILGTPHPQAEPATQGEVRWIERLQQRPVTAPAPANAIDAAEAGLWIKRLQQRAGSHSR